MKHHRLLLVFVAATLIGTSARSVFGSDHRSEPLQFTAEYRTDGAMLKTGALVGTLYVGAEAARLDLPEHPNAGHAITLLSANGELWKVDRAESRFSRLGSGDWETKVFPRLLSERDVEKIAEGECPFGSAKAEDCVKQGAETVDGRSAEKWTFKNRSVWLDPELRIALREVFKPFWKKDDTHTVEISNVRQEAQDASLFVIPAGFECDSGTFCDEAPLAP